MTITQEIRPGSIAPTTLLASARGDAARPSAGVREGAVIRDHSNGIQHGSTPGTHGVLDLMVIEHRSRAARAAIEFTATVLAVPMLGFAVYACGGAL